MVVVPQDPLLQILRELKVIHALEEELHLPLICGLVRGVVSDVHTDITVNDSDDHGTGQNHDRREPLLAY